jgi:hypothetical protein
MLTRRNLIQAGAAAALVGMSRPVFAAPRRSAYINPDLLDRALAALDAKRRFLKSTDVIAIADYARPSREERFYLLHTESGAVTSYQVSHGRGSDPRHSGYLDRFSNAHGSAASSHGAYVTGDLYEGKYGRSLRLKGLDDSNSNAQARGIVVHSAPYAEPEFADHLGKLGRSEGCFALSELSLFLVLTRLGPGRLLYSGKV